MTYNIEKCSKTTENFLYVLNMSLIFLHFFASLPSGKFQNACLQGCLFSQKLKKNIPLYIKWRSNKNLKAIEITFLMNIYNDKFWQP